MAALNGFVFRGEHSSEYGIMVNKVHRTMLPPLTEKLVHIPNRVGAHFFGKDIGVREFKVDITISGINEKDMIEQARAIGKWLNHEEESELIFDQEPDKSFYAFLSGQTDLETIVTIGQTTLTFLCPDPYAYGPEVDSAKLTTSPQTLTFGGTEKTYPVIHAKFTAPSSFLAVTAGDDFVNIGKAAIESTIVAANAKVINDSMSSTAAWTAHTTVDGGTATGSFFSNGYSFQTQTYGTGAAWHGPALKKMIATPIQDFMMDAIVGLYATQQKQIGRVEIYLLDANSAVVGKMAIKDTGGYERSRIEARAGALSGGHFYMDYEGSYTSTKKKVATTKKVKGKNVTTYTYVPEQYGSFRDFMGLLRMRRIGNLWSATVEKRDPKTGKAIVSKSASWRDTGNKYTSKVAGVAVHIGQHGTSPFMSPAYVSHLTLTNLTSITDGETQNIFDTGDEVIIDNEEGSVLLNGSPFMDYLDISSTFFSIDGGQQQKIAFEPDDKCDIIVSHRPRY